MKSECEKIKDKIADYISGILADEEAANLQRHLDDCSTCREYARALKDEDKLLTALFAEIDTNMENRQQRVLNEINRSGRSEQIKTIPIWIKIMKNRITKFATAAVILVGVLLLTNIFVKTNKSIVLAGVLDRIEKAQAYMYSIHITATESTNPEKPPIKQYINTTIIFSSEYGMKSEMDIKWDTGNEFNPGKSSTQQMYVLPDRKLSILLKPESKKYKLMELNDESITRIKQENKDPRVMMNRIMACEYTQLGRTMLDGIEVEGFETTDSKIATDMVENCEGVRVTLWVDVKTWLPVLWEMDMMINEFMQVHCIISDFQWNIPVVVSDFEPVIPEDYTDLSTEDDNAPKLSEEMTLNKDEPAGTDCCERGEAYYFDGKYDQAILELTKAIEINPGLARAYVTRGLTYEDKNEYDLAIADFTIVIEIKPTDARAYVYRGMAFENKGEYNLAIADYSKAIEVDPTISDAYRGRASAYTTQGEYDKAWEDVYKAQILGHPVDSKLLEKLRIASRRKK
jgi:tetratricopeptide (TPR) repeat protein